MKCDWDNCGQVFKKLAHLSRHKLSHIKIRPFKCQVCDFSFSRKDHLQRHIRITHESDKHLPFICHLCSRSFKLKQGLVRHLGSLFHENDEFSCEFCNKNLNNEESLQEHKLRFHSGNKFICHFCEDSFCFLFQLELHLMEHEKRIGKKRKKKSIHQCEICHKVLRTASKLRIHKTNVHDQERLFQCPICQNDYTTRRVLLRHIRLRHENINSNDLNIPDFDTEYNQAMVDEINTITHDSSCSEYYKKVFDIVFSSFRPILPRPPQAEP